MSKRGGGPSSSASGGAHSSPNPNKVKCVWGKLPGYPPWPCRYASTAEVATLNKTKKESSKCAQSGVIFLGLKLEK